MLKLRGVLTALILTSIVLLLAAGVALAAGRTMVVYNAEGRTHPHREMSLYDVDVHRFQGDSVDGFASALSDAQCLYIGQYSGPQAQAAIFAVPEYAEAVGDLLSRGGMLIFDYNGLGESLADFFAQVGLSYPGRPAGEYYDIAVAPDATPPIASEPHGISGDLGSAYGSWTDWADDFTALLTAKGEPSRAALLVADGVAGAGTVIVTQAYGIFRDEEGAPKELFENIISLAFGGLPGPGEAIAVFDPYERREPAANPCYLARSEQAPWHAADAQMRLPVVVGEPIGLERRSSAVSIPVTLPAGADAGSARVYTWAGFELPCQARVTDEAARSCEVLTVTDLAPHEQKLLYVYFGGAASQGQANPGLLEAASTGDGFALRNDRLRVMLDPEQPQPRVIAPLGARVANELANWRDVDRGMCNSIRNLDESYEVALTEDGPVRKTVAYTGPDLTISYSMLAGSDALFYEIRALQSTGVSRMTGWAPGGDGTHDTMWYESPEGLKRAVLRTGEFYRPFEDIRPFMKEGWLAFEDDRGEVVGEFFDLDQTTRVTPYVHSARGHTAPVSNQLEDGRMTGAFVAALGDHNAVRQTYIAWKNPPEAAVGAVQRPADVPEPKVPEFGRDFLRISGGLNWFLGTTTVSDPDELMPLLIRRIMADGANYVIGDDRRKEYVAPLVREAHRAGVGVLLKPRAFQASDRLCPFAHHDDYVAGAANVASYGPDGAYLVDEFQFPGNCDECRTAFEERYGMPMPEKLDFARLADPAMHNWMLYKMEVINDLIRDMTAAVREQVPDAFVFHVTSPNNHFRLEGYHDLETQSQWVTTTNSDLYSTGVDHTRYMLAYIRGAQGNDRPVFTVNGCLYDADDVALNLRQHLMYGSNALWYFDLTFSRMYPEAAGANYEGFRMLRDTGLGQVLAQARPVRHTAVLRSRAGWMACLKRGEKSGRLLDYERRIQDRVLMHNVPTEILFSSHLTPDALGDYKVLIVPSEPVIEPEVADTIAQWVQQGGRVIVEGEAARNETLARLCGVTVGDRAEGPADLSGSGPLAGADAQISSAYLQVASTEGEAVGTVGDSPAVSIAERGQGRACYVSLLDAPTELVRELVLDLGGPPPISVPEEASRDIEVSALSDGARTVVMVYNSHVNEPRTVDLTLNDLPVADGARVIEVEAGRVSDLDGALHAEVAPGHVGIYLLASPEQYAMSEVAERPPVAPVHLSMHPGTEFLRLEPEPERDADLPKKDSEKIYVAVLRNLRSPLEGCDLGATAMVAALSQRDDVVVEYVEDIDADALSRYEALIVPNMGTGNPAPNLSDGWEAEVREFVERGGGALLIHHATGFMPVSHPVFPEIAEAPDYVPITAMQVAADHPVATGQALRDRYPEKAENPAFAVYFEETAMSAGDAFQSGFADYIKLKPGPDGTAVVVSQREGNAGGDATVVAGQVGAGRVVLSGINIGCHTVPGDEGFDYVEELNDAENALLINSVYWLAAQ